MQYEIEATIPVAQYGNFKPKFIIENEEDEKIALERIASLWDTYGEKPLSKATVSKADAVKLLTFTGEDVMWSEETHTYTDMKGKVLLSGSKYAGKNSPKFPKDIVLPKMAAKTGVDAATIDSMWGMKGSMSLDIGNAMHKALEMFHLYGEDGAKIQEANGDDENYALPKQPYLRRSVIDFLEKFGADALSEVIVSDVENGMAGTIDRLEVIDSDKNICRVGDYKSNTEIKKPKMLEYQKQLSFYAHILINKGWTVEGLDLYHLDKEEKWVKVEMEVLDLE